MKVDMNDMGFGNKAAKARSLGFTVVFAPIDFLACVASGYTDEQLEIVIAEVERTGDDGSQNYKTNVLEIEKYRTKKLN